jgi:hypothetical protein
MISCELGEITASLHEFPSEKHPAVDSVYLEGLGSRISCRSQCVVEIRTHGGYAKSFELKESPLRFELPCDVDILRRSLIEEPARFHPWVRIGWQRRGVAVGVNDGPISWIQGGKEKMCILGSIL